MSTRCAVHFGGMDGSGRFAAEAKVYKHSDGYPDGIGPLLTGFFTAVQAQTQDTRFNDPSYLAAKFVVFLALRHRVSDRSMYEYRCEVAQRYNQPLPTDDGTGVDPTPLDFLGVGVIQADPEDIAYRYLVDCKHFDPETGFPQVWVEDPINCFSSSSTPDYPRMRVAALIQRQAEEAEAEAAAEAAAEA